MESSELEIGKLYAYRKKRRSGDKPPTRVKLLALVGRGGKVKVRFEDGPFPGLEEYTSTRQLVVPWCDVKAFLRDEERAEKIKTHERTTAFTTPDTASTPRVGVDRLIGESRRVAPGKSWAKVRSRDSALDNKKALFPGPLE